MKKLLIITALLLSSYSASVQANELEKLRNNSAIGAAIASVPLEINNGNKFAFGVGTAYSNNVVGTAIGAQVAIMKNIRVKSFLGLNHNMNISAISGGLGINF